MKILPFAVAALVSLNYVFANVGGPKHSGPLRKEGDPERSTVPEIPNGRRFPTSYNHSGGFIFGPPGIGFGDFVNTLRHLPPDRERYFDNGQKRPITQYIYRIFIRDSPIFPVYHFDSKEKEPRNSPDQAHDEATNRNKSSGAAHGEEAEKFHCNSTAQSPGKEEQLRKDSDKSYIPGWDLFLSSQKPSAPPPTPHGPTQPSTKKSQVTHGIAADPHDWNFDVKNAQLDENPPHRNLDHQPASPPNSEVRTDAVGDANKDVQPKAPVHVPDGMTSDDQFAGEKSTTLDPYETKPQKGVGERTTPGQSAATPPAAVMSSPHETMRAMVSNAVNIDVGTRMAGPQSSNAAADTEDLRHGSLAEDRETNATESTDPSYNDVRTSPPKEQRPGYFTPSYEITITEGEGTEPEDIEGRFFATDNGTDEQTESEVRSEADNTEPSKATTNMDVFVTGKKLAARIYGRHSYDEIMRSKMIIDRRLHGFKNHQGMKDGESNQETVEDTTKLHRTTMDTSTDDPRMKMIDEAQGIQTAGYEPWEQGTETNVMDTEPTDTE